MSEMSSPALDHASMGARRAHPVWVVPAAPALVAALVPSGWRLFSARWLWARASMPISSLRQPAFSFNDDNIPLFPWSGCGRLPARLMHGFSFSFTLMFILLAHEMGHYLYARRYQVDATPPSSFRSPA